MSRSAQTNSLEQLSDKDLLGRLERLRGEERAVLVRILYLLNEIERRRLYLSRGYASLYEFCTDHLDYSRSAAMRRIHAARCIARFPQVAGLIRSGELSLTVVSQISRIITAGNAEDILSYVRGRSTREVEMLVSRHQPGLMLRDRVRAVCVIVPDVDKNDSCRITGAGKNSIQDIDNKQDKNRGGCGEASRFENRTAAAGCAAASGMGAGSTTDCPAASDMNGADSAAERSPASGEGADSAANCSAGTGNDPENLERVKITRKYKLEFAVEPEFMEKLSRIRSMLSTKYPKDINFQTLFNILMSEYLERHGPEERLKKRNTRKIRARNKNITSKEKSAPDAGKKISSVTNDPAPTSEKRTRYIPQEIRDTIFLRDGGRCAFVSKDGHRCGSTWNLQIDHVIPYAKGGDNSPENLRILCAKHNKFQAEKEYGTRHMEKFYRRE